MWLGLGQLRLGLGQLRLGLGWLFSDRDRFVLERLFVVAHGPQEIECLFFVFLAVFGQYSMQITHCELQCDISKSMNPGVSPRADPVIMVLGQDARVKGSSYGVL
jgi:hypothetical protein